MKSWRTTTAGIAAIVTALASAAAAVANGSPVDWGAAIAAVLAGVGLITARDNLVSSESAGAK